jgi:hypothetical protein
MTLVGSSLLDGVASIFAPIEQIYITSIIAWINQMLSLFSSIEKKDKPISVESKIAKVISLQSEVTGKDILLRSPIEKTLSFRSPITKIIRLSSGC